MDGSYNNPYAQGQSPLTPDTPSGGAYKVNVNRAKTRKWVEAKVQSYDGDDWGDEYSDDDDEPEPVPPPVSRVTSGLRPVGQRLPSETHRPSPRLAEIAASASRSTSGPPSLQLQTGQSAATITEQVVPPIPAHVQDSPRNTPSPVAGRNASPIPLPSQQRQPPVATHPAEPRSSTPLSQGSTPARSSPLVHPAELYRAEEDRKSAGSPLSTRDSATVQPTEGSTPLSGDNTNQVIKPPVAAPQRDPSPEKRSSVSHTLLPDMKRLSIFASDFFSPSNEPEDAKAGSSPEKPGDVGLSGSAGKEIMKDEGVKPPTDFQSQQNEPPFSMSGPTLGLQSQAPVLPVPDPRSVPPLRTPSPNAKGTAPPEPVSSTSSRTMNSDITPTEPLQPRRLDHSPSDFAPPPPVIQQDPVLSTSTSSPVKESDMLTDEIMRTLSPVGVTPPALAPVVESSKQLALDSRQDTRSSSYTLRDYDSYWADSPDKPTPETKDAGSAAIIQQAPPQVPQEAAPKVDTSTQEPVTSSSSGDSPALRRRFSWEADFEHNAKAPKSKTPVEDPPRTGIPSTNTPSSLEQSDIQSPLDVVSDITSPRSETPKIVIPPVLEDSVAPPSQAPPSQPLPSMLEPVSSVSTLTEETTSQVTGDRRPSLPSDVVLSEIPSHPLSDASALETQPAAQDVPLVKPRPVPQVKGVREIMAMGTSEKRINEYEQSRKAFAEADLGLETWILAIKQQHPEYANITSSFSGNSYQSSSTGGNAAISSGSSAPAQQPYYQQYLNASSPTTTAPPSGRSRLGGLPLSTQATSAFGNSSNQIGTKSKEFMHSAGKMGKGLLSKGRSKLRGTGDKGEPIPPPVVHQPKAKKERRASWSISIGARSRTEPPTSSDKEKKWLSGYYPPSSSQSRRMHPFRSASWGSEPGRSRISLGSLSSRVSSSRGSSSSKIFNEGEIEASGSHSRDNGQDGKEQVTPKSTPVDKDSEHRSRWDVFRLKPRQQQQQQQQQQQPAEERSISVSIPVAEGKVTGDDTSEHSSHFSGVQLDRQSNDSTPLDETAAAAPAASIDESDGVSFSDDDWVEIVTPHSTAASIRMVPAEPALVEARPSLSLTIATAASVARGETRLTPVQTPARSHQAIPNSAGSGITAQPDQAQAKPQTQPPQAQARQAQNTSQPSSSVQTQSQTNINPQTRQRRRTKEMSFSSTHQQPADDIPKRNSSFIGLPPIRRGSTFGWGSPASSSALASSSQAARPAAERFSLDDDYDEPPSQPPPPAAIPASGPVIPAALPARFPGNGTVVAGNGAMTDVANFTTSHPQQQQGVALTNQTTRMSFQHGEMSPSSAPPEPSDPVRDSMHPPRLPGSPDQHEGHQPSQLQHQTPSPFDGAAVATTAAASGGSGGGGGGEGSSGGAPPMMPPNMAGNPIQKLPPSGPWKLEESHLSEPLHPVARNRAGTGSSQQQPYFGYDKETGVTLPQESLVSPTTSSSPRPRPKVSEVPPSSTRRYPDLFREPRSRSNSNINTPQPQPQPQPQQPDHQSLLGRPQDLAVPRAVTAGPEVEGGEDRDRRKSSGLFKDFGSRFSRPSSEHRGSSSADPNVTQQPQPPADQGVDRFGPGIPIEEMNQHPGQRKPPRGSFLFSLRGRPSMDSSPNQVIQPQRQPQVLMQAPAPIGQEQTRPETPQSQSERKHSRFSSGFGAITGGHLKVKSSGPTRSSTSSMVNEPSNSEEHMPHPKKRFSGFGTRDKSGGIFHRQSVDIIPKPSTPRTMQPPTGIATPGHPGSVAPSPSTGGFQRSNTDNPMPYGQQQTQMQAPSSPDRRKRRGSAGSLISGFLGHGKKNQPQGGPMGHSQEQPQVPLPQLPPGQNPLGQHPPGQHSPGRSPLTQPPLTQSQDHFAARQPQGRPPPGHLGFRPNPQVQIPGGQPPSNQSFGLAPQLPPLGPVSPVQLQRELSWGQLPPAPGQTPPSSQSPTHPPMLRRMTGNSLLDSQVHPNTERPGSIDVGPPEQGQGFVAVTEQNKSQVSLNQPRPSPLRQESPLMSKETPAVPSVHDSPRPSVHTLPAPPDDASSHMRSGSGRVSPVRSGPLSHVSNHTSKHSLDMAMQQKGIDITEPQRPTMDSPSLSYRSVQPGHARIDSHSRDELPLSPVSQMSRTGPPSIASSNLGQSPRLASAAVNTTSRGSQPATPTMSAPSTTPPMQNQGFSPRMAPPPQLQSTPTSPLQQQNQGLPSPRFQQQQQQQQQPPHSPFQQQQEQKALSSTSLQQQQRQQHPPPSPFQQQQQQPPLPPPGLQQQRQQMLGSQQSNGPSRTQTPSLHTRPSYQTMPSPSSQSSIPLSRPSLQLAGPQIPPKDGVTAHGPPPAMLNPPPGQAGSSSKWKGLRNRMSAQMVTKQLHEQGKPEGGEKKTSRLFGAFKRSSKVPPQGQPQGPQGYFHSHPHGAPQGVPMQQQMYAPGQQMPHPGQQVLPRQQMYSGQQAQIRPGQPIPVGQQMPPGQQQTLRQQVVPGQQGPPRQIAPGQQVRPAQQGPPQQMTLGQQQTRPAQQGLAQQRTPGQQGPPQQMALGQQGPPQQMALGRQGPPQQMALGQQGPPQQMALGQQGPPQQMALGQQGPPQQMTLGQQQTRPAQQGLAQQRTPGQQGPPQQLALGQQQTRPVQQGPPQQLPLGQQQTRPAQQVPPQQAVPEQQQALAGQQEHSQQVPRGQQQTSPAQQSPPQQMAPGQQGPPQQITAGQQSLPPQMVPGQQLRPGQSILVEQTPPGQHGPPQQVAPPQTSPQQTSPQRTSQQIPPGQQSPPIQQSQQFVAQIPRSQSFASRQSSQFSSPPIGQQPFPPANSAGGQQPHPTGPLPAQSTGPPGPVQRQPGPPAQSVMNPRQGTPKGFQRPFKSQPQQHLPGQRFTEPQYDRVPIPQGYHTVHAEGGIAPSLYNVGQNLNHQDSFIRQQPQQQIHSPVQETSQPLHSQPQSPASITGPPAFRGQPISQPQMPISLPTSPITGPPAFRGQPLSQPQTPMSQPTSPQYDSHVHTGPGYKTIQGETHTLATPGGGSVDSSLQSPPLVHPIATNPHQILTQVQRAATNASYGSSHGSGTSNETPEGVTHVNSVSALGSETQSNDPRSPPLPSSENGFLRPQNSTTPPSLSAGSITPSRETTSPVYDGRNGTREDHSRPISLSPPMEADGKASPSISHTYSTSALSDDRSVSPNTTKVNTQGSAEDLGIDSSDGVQLHKTGESQEDTVPREAANGRLMRAQTRNRGAPAELADTEDAHMRKIRLESQEEKIHFDPDADSDGEPPPQMSATSYPGQEWNPYGMPEYGEWNE